MTEFRPSRRFLWPSLALVLIFWGIFTFNNELLCSSSPIMEPYWSSRFIFLSWNSLLLRQRPPPLLFPSIVPIFSGDCWWAGFQRAPPSLILSSHGTNSILSSNTWIILTKYRMYLRRFNDLKWFICMHNWHSDMHALSRSLVIVNHRFHVRCYEKLCNRNISMTLYIFIAFRVKCDEIHVERLPLHAILH